MVELYSVVFTFDYNNMTGLVNTRLVYAKSPKDAEKLAYLEFVNNVSRTAQITQINVKPMP